MKPGLPSELVQAAAGLDDIFASLEQMAGSLGRIDLTTEASCEKAKQVLIKFSARSQELGAGLARLSQALDARRVAVEQAVVSVNDLAPAIQRRLEELEEKVDRFRQLAGRVKDVTEAATELGPVEVAARLRALIEEAGALEEDASAASMRNLERDIRTLKKNLGAIAAKLEGTGS